MKLEKKRILSFFNSLRVRTFLITLVLISLPQLFTAYLFINEAEESLFRERAAKLNGIASQLEREFYEKIPLILAEFSSNPLPADKKREYMESQFIATAYRLQSSYAQVGLGYFLLDYGGEIAVLRPTISPQERRYSIELPLIYQGKSLGYAFAEESLQTILKDLENIQRTIFLILTLSLLLGIGGAYLLSSNLSAGVKVIKDGLTEIGKDLKARVMPLQGELGEVEEAINQLASSLESALSQLNLVFETSPIGLLLLTVDQEGKYQILLNNRQFLKLLDIPENEPRALLSREELFLPEVIKSLKKIDKTKHLNLSYRDRYFDLLVVGLGEDGALLLLEEVTERNQLLEELKRKERVASLGLLIASLAHEIKNPLTSIKGYGELLLKQPLKDKEKMYLNHILKESERVNNLISELLYLGRPVSLKKSPVKVKGLLSEVLLTYKPLIEQNGIQVETNIPSDLEIMLDSEKILRALSNLIKNALESMAAGGVLTLKSVVDSDNFLLTITDNGKGMSSNELENIFDPFYSTKEKGVGLGLSVAHSIVKAHDGHLSVSSVEGVGTTFTLSLPR